MKVIYVDWTNESIEALKEERDYCEECIDKGTSYYISNARLSLAYVNAEIARRIVIQWSEDSK